MSSTAAGASPLRRTRRLRADDRGAASVELALVLPVLLLLVIGMIRFGVAYNAKIEMSGAAREAARHMVVRPTDQAGAEATARVAASLTGATVSISNNCAPGARVTVTIQRNVPMSIPFGPTADLSVTGSASMQC